MQPQLLAAHPAGLVAALHDLVRITAPRIDFARCPGERNHRIRLFENQAGYGISIGCRRLGKADKSLLEGDGFLHRFASALGMDWTISSVGDHEAMLRCMVAFKQ